MLAAAFVPAAAASAYGPDEEPTLVIDVLQPICDGDVPYLQYAVSVDNPASPPESATITWVNPNDPSQSFVQSGVPLSGTVLWPGAEVDAAGNGIDWPGWTLEGDQWVEGDEWDWVRPSVQVTIAVNPEATVTVPYPPSSPACLTNPPGQVPPPSEAHPPPAEASGPSSNLASTGASVGWLVAVGAVLVAAGTALISARKRAGRS